MVLSRPSTPKTIDGELSQELDGGSVGVGGTIRVAVLALVGSLAAGIGEATVYEYDRDGRVIVRHFPGVDAERQTATRLAATDADRAMYREMAEKVALRHAGGDGPRRAGLDALTFMLLFVELIRVESAFHPYALSSKGAQGLGQLMPETARALGVTDAFDPAQNLDGAARYFSAQLARFGDVALALAAYNAGPDRVIEYGGVPPFPETRAYVGKITAAAGRTPMADPAPSANPEPHPVVATEDQKDLSVWQY